MQFMKAPLIFSFRQRLREDYRGFCFLVPGRYLIRTSSCHLRAWHTQTIQTINNLALNKNMIKNVSLYIYKTTFCKLSLEEFLDKLGLCQTFFLTNRYHHVL